MLTERFCQDVLEEYFGCQPGIGRRNNNPTVSQFDYNDTRWVIKVGLLLLQEMQNVNIKIKEKPHGMMLTTSFFEKEKRNYYTLATYMYIRR